MFIAMRVLLEHPNLAALVATRFDEIIVDEAQDMSDVQMQCLAQLRQTGQLRSLVLIGDPDQTIYEWQGSDADACLRFCNVNGLDTLTLNANFRSSQAICDVTYKLSKRSTPTEARGPCEAFGVPPEVMVYDASDPHAAVDQFIRRMRALELDFASAPVLVRTNTLASRLNRQTAVRMNWQVRVLGEAAVEFRASSSFTPSQVASVEAAIRYFAWGLGYPLDLSQRVALRDAAAQLIPLLPTPSDGILLRDWIAEVREFTNRSVASLTADPLHAVHTAIKTRGGDRSLSVIEAFPQAPPTPVARTVHSVKGESHDAVLLVADKVSTERDNARDWIKGVMGEDLDEETRIGYVAITRARRYCCVAIPDSTSIDVIEAYLDAGFVTLEIA